jgi:hypothetical protein
VVLSLGLVLQTVAPAHAHDRSVSYSSWDIRGRDAHVTVRVSQLDVSNFPWAATAGEQLDRVLPSYLSTHLQLLAGDAPCPSAEPPRRLDAAPGRLAFEWDLTCGGATPLRIVSTLFLEVAPSHLHFARVKQGDSEPLERVLSAGQSTWPVGNQTAADLQQPEATLSSYVALGLQHLWTGYDHLAFLLALLLIASTPGEVARVIAGFTIAHSITLALAVLGYVRPDTTAIGALIGLSIALVAAENVWLLSGRTRRAPWLIAAALGCLALWAASGHGRIPGLTLAGLALFSLCYFSLLAGAAHPAPLRWTIAFIFGLLHGFGFASLLAAVRLPPERLVGALFGFNVGVELGQLAVVALVWPVFRFAARTEHSHWHRSTIEVGSAAVCGLGIFWFVSRTFG